MDRFNISGYLGKDPELKVGKNGMSYVNISLGVSGNKSKTEQTTFVFITCFSQTAENIAKYLSKGDYIIVNGHHSVSTREIDGKKLSRLELIGDYVEFVNTHKKQEQKTTLTESALKPQEGIVNVISDDELSELPF